MEIDDGLIGHWSPTLDPVGSGATLADLVGINDGTITGSGTWIVDTEGNGTRAIQFDGASGNVDCGPVFRTPALFTISIWLKKTGSAGNKGVMGSWASGFGYMIYSANATEIKGYVNSAIATDPNPITINQWAHAVLTGDGINSILYIDGNQADTVAVSLPSSSNQDFVLANYSTSPGSQTFDGEIDSARIYDRVLTPAEVTELYNAGRGEEFGPPPGPTFQPAWAAGRTTRIIQGSVNV